MVILVVALIAAIALSALLAYRLTELRREGTAVLLRRVPAGADEGWRHGTIAYSDSVVRFYRLSSLRPGPTVTLVRSAIEVSGRRRPVGTEDVILGGMTVVELGAGADGANGGYELAMSAEALTAFQAWLESRQSARSQRRKR